MLSAQLAGQLYTQTMLGQLFVWLPPRVQQVTESLRLKLAEDALFLPLLVYAAPAPHSVSSLSYCSKATICSLVDCCSYTTNVGVNGLQE